ncbi:MAG: sigma factor G inhibitor Gin [Desulfitobacteriaceae bacterium]|nr:sigma factor G inhibitor Gin [Desulfitobacteriaceae bacterium]MDI6879306.1 sigma factor G inhibitor Gin [Desulfitobacteriaceae bacterium]MDI6915258.1 sigma factor G inhibitor Gin [Desulfitobacteriaceae bacterium]
MGELHPVCQSCGKVPYLGLYDGFRIHGRFFCTECEQRLLTEAIGSAFYLKMAQHLRFLGNGQEMEVLRPGAWRR